MQPIKPLQLDEATHANLKRLAKEHGRSMKQLVGEMVNYFKQTGQDPQQVNAGSSANAIKSLEKRFTTFMRNQEKERLTPMLDELAIVSKLLREKAETMLDKPTFKHEVGRLLNNQKIINDNQQNQASQQELVRLKSTQEQSTKKLLTELNQIKEVISEKMSKKGLFS